MGKITTTKTDVDNFTAIKLTTAKGEVYNITLDEKGKGVASSMRDQRVCEWEGDGERQGEVADGDSVGEKKKEVDGSEGDKMDAKKAKSSCTIAVRSDDSSRSQGAGRDSGN